MILRDLKLLQKHLCLGWHLNIWWFQTWFGSEKGGKLLWMVLTGELLISPAVCSRVLWDTGIFISAWKVCIFNTCMYNWNQWMFSSNITADFYHTVVIQSRDNFHTACGCRWSRRLKWSNIMMSVAATFCGHGRSVSGSGFPTGLTPKSRSWALRTATFLCLSLQMPLRLNRNTFRILHQRLYTLVTAVNMPCSYHHHHHRIIICA